MHHEADGPFQGTNKVRWGSKVLFYRHRRPFPMEELALGEHIAFEEILGHLCQARGDAEPFSVLRLLQRII